MTLLEPGGKLIFVNRTFVYKICIIVVIIFDYICIFRMLCLVIVKDAGSFKKTSKGVTDGIAGSKKNKAGILLQGKIKKRREAFGAMSFS